MSDNNFRNPSTEGGPQRYRKRAYGKSCYPCRQRKIRCEGGNQPPCKQCRELNTLCEPASGPRYAKRAQDPSEPDQEAANPDAHAFAELERRVRRLEALANIQETPPAINVAGVLSHDQQDDETLERPSYDLGSAARPEYHGELSMFDDSGFRPSAAATPSEAVNAFEPWNEERLSAAARLRHRYATPEEGEEWMTAYFCWASPVYSVVHRPVFIRDMALNGPYFSQFLLVMIYITGIRLTYGMDPAERAAKGERYVSLAMSMLADEVMAPGSIPTIQALLGLAGRQSAVGKTSQAWMLTGMAFRMMKDMGLHLPIEDGVSSVRFSAEERDMRRRVFWSAYCWDKTMSLTLGREPSMTCPPGLSPDELPDDPDDRLLWSPQLTRGARLPLGRPYPPTPLLKTFAFKQSCRLNLILESILTNMYSPERPNARSMSFIRSAVENLDNWRNSLPVELKLEKQILPPCSPPANVVILNLLYHTMRILLYRPLLTAGGNSAIAPSALQHCRTAAIGTHDIMSFWGRTFGQFCHHYLILYCCFISAGVDVLLIRAGNQFLRAEAFQRVHLFLDILEQASAQGPAIKRGIVNIRSQLDRVTKEEMNRVNEVVSPMPIPQPPLPTASEPVFDMLNMANPQTNPASIPQSTNFQFQTGMDGFWGNTQDLMELLGAAPISTEDPFAFGTGQEWSNWTI